MYNLVSESGNANVLITDAFKDVGIDESGEVKLLTTKYLAVSDSTKVNNSVEIIELSGKRTIDKTTPGNYDPTRTLDVSEADDDYMDLQITPPTGSTINYIPYIIAITVTSIVLVLGIVIIKKKLVK